eukprot:1818779-Amphidinium_carterae.1
MRVSIEDARPLQTLMPSRRCSPMTTGRAPHESSISSTPDISSLDYRHLYVTFAWETGTRTSQSNTWAMSTGRNTEPRSKFGMQPLYLKIPLRHSAHSAWRSPATPSLQCLRNLCKQIRVKGNLPPNAQRWRKNSSQLFPLQALVCLENRQPLLRVFYTAETCRATSLDFPATRHSG